MVNPITPTTPPKAGRIGASAPRTFLLAAAFLSAASPFHAQNSLNLTGLVEDNTGAIIPNARVELQHLDGSLIATINTDSSGQFSIPLPPAGDDRITVALPGFEPVVRPLHITRTPPAALMLIMRPASVSTTVDVSADTLDMASPDNNQDVASVSAEDIKTLPVLDGDIVATLSAFLSAGATGEGGATLIVDGVEMKTAGVAPSAIERVSINQDPYSAQYRQPGRGQVEIVTKNTADKFHGSASFAIRDHIFDAKDRFATVKPPNQRLLFEGYLTGPIHPFRNTTFLLSSLVQHQNTYNQVTASTGIDPVTLMPIVPSNVLAPYRNYNLTMKVARQLSDHHSAYLLYRFFDSSRGARGTGGLSLGTAGYTMYRFDMDLTFHDDIAFAPNKFNAFSILFERNADRQVSTVQSPSIIVQGAFNGGGAQADEFQTENNPNISDIVSWSVGGASRSVHQFKFGVQFPNLGRRVLEDFSNRQGTYTFASLAAYQANAPLSFSLQQGQSRFLTHYDQPSAFFLDQIQATARLTITPGIRYDFQNALPNTKDAILPRLSFAYLLDKQHAMVIRTGGGLYMRRVGVNLGQQLARYEHAAERSLLITTGICYPTYNAPGCPSLPSQPPSLYIDAPNLKAPFQGFFGLSVEREITRKSTLTIGYEGYRGWHALQSIDINAPLPPFTTYARPNPSFSQITQQSSGGIQRSDALNISYKGRIRDIFSGYLQYTYGHADSNTEWSTFFPQNQYKPNDEWSRTETDQRHRANLIGTFYPDKPLTLGLGFYAYSAAPYTVTTGTDDYKTGLANARPAGVPRNSLNGGQFHDLQVRLNYTRKLRPSLKDASPTLAFSASSFNALNASNYQNYIGVITSPHFKQPTADDNPRRLQFGVAYNF